jgi:hypothetical protein
MPVPLTVSEVESLVVDALGDEHLAVIHSRSLLLIIEHTKVPSLLVDPAQAYRQAHKA